MDDKSKATLVANEAELEEAERVAAQEGIHVQTVEVAGQSGQTHSVQPITTNLITSAGTSPAIANADSASSSSDDHEEQTGTVPKKKPRKITAEKTLPKTNKAKNQAFNRRMATLKETINDLTKQYKDKLLMHLVAEYTPFNDGPRPMVPRKYEFGAPLVSEKYVTQDELKNAIAEAKQQLAVASTSNKMLPKTPEKPPPSTSVLPSPAKSGLIDHKSNCQKRVCSFSKTLGKRAVWITCNWRNEATNETCNYQVHAKCHGYPEATKAEVEAMPSYYCPVHILLK